MHTNCAFLPVGVFASLPSSKSLFHHSISSFSRTTTTTTTIIIPQPHYLLHLTASASAKTQKNSSQQIKNNQTNNNNSNNNASNSASASSSSSPSSSTLSIGTVIAIGLSHHTATVEIREKLSIPEDQWIAAGNQLAVLDGVAEAAVLSTCNRFEIYLLTDPASPDPALAIHNVSIYLAQRSGLPLHQLRKYLFFLQGNPAVFHLLQVSAGLDSLVVGEGQILAQVKKCYELSSSKEGAAGKVLTRLLNVAVSAGKRVRNETEISKGAVSISSAAVELAEWKAPQDLSHFNQINDASIAIIGAGNMARLLVQHLSSKDVKQITVVNRTIQRCQDLANMFPDVTLRSYTMDHLLDVVKDADIVFTSTSSELPILSKQNLAPFMDATSRQSNLMLIDISVPRNVDQNVANIPTVKPYNVDDLKAVVARNQAKRKRLIIEAELLLQEELQMFNNWHNSLSCVPAITKLQKRAELIRVEELERVMGKLENLSPEQKEAVQRLSKGIINKMLHGPMAHLRGLQDVDDVTEQIKNFEALFKI